MRNLKQTETGKIPEGSSRNEVTVTEELLSKAISHTLGEAGFDNMKLSLKSNLKEMQQVHDSIHEFMYLASLCAPSTIKVSWHSKSAFLLYHWEAFNSAHRSYLEALAGYYNPAHTLSRNTLELLINGAFYECLAHKQFRENAKILDEFKDSKKRKSIKNWVEELIRKDPSIETDFEKSSVAIYDKFGLLFNERDYQKRYVWLPSFSQTITQLIAWDILDVPNAQSIVYDTLYRELSKEVHLCPYNIDTGRRLLLGKTFFETVVINAELIKFKTILHQVIDIGIVIELNILSDWIKQDETVKTKLEERIAPLDELELKLASEKIKNLVKT